MIDWQDLTGLTGNKQSSWFWIITFSSYLSIFSLVASKRFKGWFHVTALRVSSQEQVTLLRRQTSDNIVLWIKLINIQNWKFASLHSSHLCAAVPTEYYHYCSALHCQASAKPAYSPSWTNLLPHHVCDDSLYLEHKIILELSKTKTVGERKN